MKHVNSEPKHAGSPEGQRRNEMKLSKREEDRRYNAAFAVVRDFENGTGMGFDVSDTYDICSTYVERGSNAFEAKLIRVFAREVIAQEIDDAQLAKLHAKYEALPIEKQGITLAEALRS